MSRATDQLEAVRAFLSEHETTLDNAATVYVERFRKESASVQAEYDRAQADPELAASYEAPGSLISLNGLRQSAQLFAQAADRTERAREALAKLSEQLEDAGF